MNYKNVTLCDILIFFTITFSVYIITNNTSTSFIIASLSLIIYKFMYQLNVENFSDICNPTTLNPTAEETPIPDIYGFYT